MAVSEYEFKVLQWAATRRQRPDRAGSSLPLRLLAAVMEVVMDIYYVL